MKIRAKFSLTDWNQCGSDFREINFLISFFHFKSLRQATANNSLQNQLYLESRKRVNGV